MVNNYQLVRVYNDAISIRMLQRLQITCGLFSGVVHKAYHSQWNLKNCTVANIAIKAFLRV